MNDDELNELRNYYDNTDTSELIETSTLDTNCISFNQDTEVTVWVNSQGFSPPGPPISNYLVTVQFGSTELPGYADIAYTGDDDYDKQQCLIAAQVMLDHFRSALITARIPKDIQRQ